MWPRPPSQVERGLSAWLQVSPRLHGQLVRLCLKPFLGLGIVAHTFNPSIWEGRSRGISVSLKQAWSTNRVQRNLVLKRLKKKDRQMGCCLFEVETRDQELSHFQLCVQSPLLSLSPKEAGCGVLCCNPRTGSRGRIARPAWATKGSSLVLL